MFIQTDNTNDLHLPFDASNYAIPTEEAMWETGNYSFEIDGTGKLQIVNTGGTSAAEGGMGSGGNSETEKGDLKGNVVGKESTKQGSKEDNGWDPIKENIEENTAKRNDDKD